MKEGCKVDLLVFDGCMIRKEDKEITNDLLSGLSEYVYEKQNINLNLLKKT